MKKIRLLAEVTVEKISLTPKPYIRTKKLSYRVASLIILRFEISRTAKT